MNEKNMPCAYWREGEICAKGTEPGYTDFCVLGPCSQMKPSKGDKIRQMSDEELVDAWYYIYYHVIFASTDSRQGLLEWLKQEVESDG